METSALHFAQAGWGWGLLAIPAMLLGYAIFYHRSETAARLERLADKHLIPHLLLAQGGKARSHWRGMMVWSLLWALGIAALAGPRWDYTEVESFKPSRNLVIVLDLSSSMAATDVKPSRMAMARQQIDALLQKDAGLSVGLIGYAGDAHRVSPLTDDARALRSVVPYLDTSVPFVQGDDIHPALVMAGNMLRDAPSGDRSILVVSDGDFDAAAAASDAGGGIVLYTLGVGTTEGAPIPSPRGGWRKGDDGRLALSRLNEAGLAALSRGTGGFYLHADYAGNAVNTILGKIAERDDLAQKTSRKVRIWEEHFWLPVLGIALLMLPWFRRGYVFPLILIAACFGVSGHAEAADWRDVFRNKPQQGRAHFDAGDFKGAIPDFDTPYQKGVAQYKAGDYAAAEKSFAESSGDRGRYNLGNAQVEAGHYDAAIASYHDVLKRDPKNENARHNLEIAQKLKALQNKSAKSPPKEQKPKDPQKDAGGKDAPDQQAGKPEKSEKNGKDQPKDAAGAQDGKPQDKDGQNGAGQPGKSSPPPEDAADPLRGNEGGGTENKPEKSSLATAKPDPSGQDKAAGNAPPHNASASDNPSAPPTSPQSVQSPKVPPQSGSPRAQKDVDADQWLNRIDNDPQSFLKNQFRIESQMNGASQGENP